MRRSVTMAAGLSLVFLLTGCGKPSEMRRVAVSSPENWGVKESRSCVLAGEDPVSKLPHLNCDLPALDKPRSQLVVMDVKFATSSERLQYVEWTCQRTNKTLICGN